MLTIFVCSVSQPQPFTYLQSWSLADGLLLNFVRLELCFHNIITSNGLRMHPLTDSTSCSDNVQIHMHFVFLQDSYQADTHTGKY